MVDNRFPATLCAISLASYGLSYAVSLVLARHLSIRSFDDYNVAVSVTLILVSIATLGLEKYALRCLPEYRERKDWSHAHGFVRFAVLCAGILGLLFFALLTVALETTLFLVGAEAHLTIVAVACSIPVISVFQVLLETATAYGKEVVAFAIYRLLVPILILGLNLAVVSSEMSSSGVKAAVCFNLAWWLALGVAFAVFRSAKPADAKASPVYEPRTWLVNSLPFLVNSLLLTVHAQIGVIVLELLYPSESVVSIYAVAAQTGTFVVIIGTATNRFYLPRLAVLLTRNDQESIRTEARRRYQMLLPLMIVFVCLFALFGRRVLAAFGPEFDEGYAAAFIIAVGASVSTALAMAPLYLKFIGRAALVTGHTAAAVAVHLVLCVVLGSYFGATGVAISYSATLAGLYGILRMRIYWLATID